MSPTTIHRRLLAFIRAERLVAPQTAIILGISGGPDSMALLEAMTSLAARRDTDWRLHIAHLNHCIRARAAARDADFVRRQGLARRLPVHIEKLDVPAYADEHRLTLEEAARRCRYAFLQHVAEAVGAPAVAIGHHADDQAETILHHIIRGTGLRGLAGMPIARPIAADSPICLVRPLLGFRRRDILAYLSARRVQFQTDRTNVDSRHTRNRIRRRLMPSLERQFNPGVTAALLRLGVQARWAADLIVEIAEGMLAQATAAGARPRAALASASNAIVLPYAALRAAPPIVQAEVVRLALDRLGAHLRETGFERLSAVVRALSGSQGGRSIELPGGMQVMRRGRHVIIESRDSRRRAERL